jgi:hypothetical protein
MPHYNKRKAVILQEIPEEWEYRRVIADLERETRLSIFTTWELPFEQMNGIREERESKDHFLTLAAFFDNQMISERYFQAYFALHGPDWMNIFSTEKEWDSYKFGDILSGLRKLSLLRILDKQTGETLFSIHLVVRDWMKLRKSNHIQRQFAQESAEMLASYLAKVQVAIDEMPLETKQETLLHLDACVQHNRELVEGLSHFDHHPDLAQLSFWQSFSLLVSQLR